MSNPARNTNIPHTISIMYMCSNSSLIPTLFFSAHKPWKWFVFYHWAAIIRYRYTPSENENTRVKWRRQKASRKHMEYERWHKKEREKKWKSRFGIRYFGSHKQLSWLNKRKNLPRNEIRADISKSKEYNFFTFFFFLGILHREYIF